MPNPRDIRPTNTNNNNNNDELDDDDEDGSKAEDGDYEDVRGFDEEKDLLLGNSGANKNTSPNRSPPKPVTAGAAVPNSTAVNGGSTAGSARTTAADRKKKGGALSTEELDSQRVLLEVARIVAFPWPAAAGKRPPRDMKRLDESEWYIVCKVMKWGDTPALFLRSLHTPEDDFGFYKPPVQYYEYQFQVGDRLQLSQTGYSASRNKIATSIRVKPTHMFPVSNEKTNWVPPPITEALVSSEGRSRSKRDKQGDDSSDQDKAASIPKRKKIKEEEHIPTTMAHRLALNEYAALQSLAQSSPLTLQKKLGSEKMPPFSFFGQPQQQQSFASASVLGQAQPTLSASQLFLPGTPDLHRAPSLTGFPFSMQDLYAGGLIPPSSPNLLGSTSPLLGGAGQPTIHRIASAGGFGSFSSISSPSTNCPPFSASFRFPSASNMTFGTSSDPSGGN